MKTALLGFGVVGSGAYGVWERMNSCPEIEIARVLDLREFPQLGDKLTHDIDDIIEDKSIECVAEAIIGFEPAFGFAEKVMRAGKHFVSANKLMVSRRFRELNTTARESGVRFLYTACAGGGIQWLYNLRRTLRCDRVRSISAILNGTTNYILSNMKKRGAGFDEMLADAQRLGYAEANPSSDIDGLDLKRKCTISASVAFNTFICEDDVPAAGIRGITAEDIAYFSGIGTVCKMLLRASEKGSCVSAYVEPTLLKAETVLAQVPDNFNYCILNAASAGELAFYGQGAGKYPTGFTVVQDMLDVAHGVEVYENTFDAPLTFDNSGETHRYYLRVSGESYGGELDFCAAMKEELGSQIRIITNKIPVSVLHSTADILRKKDANVFFAGIAD